LLTAGVRPAWAPGTCFEYSNLGYALLGRVIAAAAQTSYPAFVAARLLGPLGLGQTGFEAADFDSAQLARGYRRSPDGWAELAPDGYGAFAPMGGAFSSVRDLARWAGGFAAAFPPGDPDAGDPHPLPRAARREMQLPQVALRLRPQLGLPGNPGAGSQHSYGFGLFIEESSTWGRIVYHSGGYPGFGSHMRWHPATGLGVIVLANSTYAGAHPLAVRLMEALLQGGPIGAQLAAGNGQPLVRGPAPAPGGPWPETVDAQQVVTRLLGSWDDAVAHRLFADNVALDEPYPQRRAKIERIWQRIGPPRGEPPRPAEFDSPAHCRWWLPGERGDAQVEILLTPEDPPRVQSLTLSVPPAPDSPVWQHAQTVISLINDAPSRWPTELPASASLDTAVLIRQLRMAGAWAGRCRPGAFCGGNGQTSTVVEVDGEHARLTLAVELDPDQSLNRVEITLLS
jgi:hypothetical protein